MRYDLVAADNITKIRPLTVEDFKQNPEIKKARRRLLVALSIKWVIIAIIFSLLIVLLNHHNKVSDKSAHAGSVGEFVAVVLHAIREMLYCCIFIRVVTKYRRTAILIFAWLTVIGLIDDSIELISACLTGTPVSRATDDSEIRTSTMMILISLVGINNIVSVLAIVFSFKLVKLLKIPKVHQIV